MKPKFRVGHVPKEFVCVFSDCDRSVRSRNAVCTRCNSWWYYHSLQSAAEYASYLNRHNLAHVRIENASGVFGRRTRRSR